MSRRVIAWRPPTELPLVDAEYVRHLLEFLRVAVTHHRAFSAAVFLIALLLGALTSMTLPRTWHVETRLLVDPPQLMRVIDTPRDLTGAAPAPSARELVLARKNLENLILQTNLLEEWQRTRSPLLRLKDRAVTALAGPVERAELIDALVGLLERRIYVSPSGQTVTIAIDWPDPRMALLLVETAQQSFLETRHVAELTAFSEALAILEEHAAAARRHLDSSVSTLEQVRLRRQAGMVPTTAWPDDTGDVATPSPEPSLTPTTGDQEVMGLRVRLAARRSALADLEETRRQRVLKLSAELEELRLEYGPQHPEVRDLTLRLAIMRADSPQMTRARADIAFLKARCRELGVEADDPPAPVVDLPPEYSGDDPYVEFAYDNLRKAAAQYTDLLQRIDVVRAQRDSTQAAFKYRYSVVKPPMPPREPASPHPALLAVVTLGFATLSAAVACGLREQRR